jgi:BTB/POZ domain-containing protein KCTD9
MESLPQKRQNYHESCRRLLQEGWLEGGEIPPMPAQRPRHDDPEPLGVSFFRTRVEGDFSHMTLSRTFFGRSEVAEASFRNTDLAESTLCWNDFVNVDFSDGSLRGSDLRAAMFNSVSFVRCDLRDADLRRSTFKNCDFTDADMHGTTLTRRQAAGLGLSSRQLEIVEIRSNDGEQPGGG